MTAARNLLEIYFWGEGEHNTDGSTFGTNAPSWNVTAASEPYYDTFSLDKPPSMGATRTPYLTRGSTAWMSSNRTSTSTSNLSEDNARYVPGWYTGVFIIAFFAVVCFGYVLRYILSKYFGCGTNRNDPAMGVRHSQHRLALGRSLGRTVPDNQALRALGLAATEEVREAQVEKQRMERRLWYMFYLKAYTTVLTEEHFECGDKLDDDGSSELSELEEGRSVPGLPLDPVDAEKGEESSASWGTASVTEETHDNDEVLPDVDLSEPNAKKEDATVEDFLFSSGRMIKIWDTHDTTYRCVEANCSICLGDYEVGDEIVQSAAERDEEYCIHVFHSECMLQWLAKGKKRCPICRHWFVPSVRIKQQMKEAHVVTRPNSMHHLYDATSRQPLASLRNTTESELSRTAEGDNNDHDGHDQVGAQLQRDGGHGSRTSSATPDVNQQQGVQNENDIELGLPGERIEVPGWGETDVSV